MKKLLAIMAVSVFVLSACGSTKPVESAAEKTAKFVDYFVEYGCLLAKYDGEIPDAEDVATNAKYGFNTDEDVGKAMKAEKGNMPDIIAKAVPRIEAKCKEDFAKAGVDPKGFIESTFEEYNK